ncbi:DNA double-strand break repair rad50 ATPase, putative [Ricinus communis]|uniref:DNA double-strand break repair rad50 ATPase, putative n=2 Tax=Ricinus communis TaxID=3988 RepID=B9SJ00_RICCO|nr:DNA double-strand break repair rad50 ATPase, putative [Ricinus communis]
MFTPQRKVWSGWSLTPRSEKTGSGSDSKMNGLNNVNSGDASVLKGKSVAFAEPVTPNGVGLALDGDDVGLVEKISKLENELFDYQYNMGILLIEKKEWTSKYEELKQAIREATDALKREQAAHLIAISDAERREENLRKALGVEKQCVLDLEKAVREMRSENAELKFTADSKLAEANALIISVEEKSLEVESKLHAADAKLAEVSRKSSEIDRKSQDVESRESALRRERISFIAEKEAHESTLSRQREDLREWERKLQEGEERISKGQRIINQREERANENDRILKQKEKDLEEAQKKIDEAEVVLKNKEDEMTIRLANLTLKEKEFDATGKKLEMKEEKLRSLEESLNDREKVEIQKLIDEHTAILEVKKREFELEADQKRKSLDEELKNKVNEVEKKEAEIKHMEDKVLKREQALDKKLDKLKEKEKEFESKSKALKEKEKTIKSEEKNLENEKRQLNSDKENFLNLKAELEKIRAANEEQLLKIREEKDQLKVNEEERVEYVRLQSELKEEIEKCRLQEQLFLKEVEDLKQQKENFEREWDDLDEKRVEIEKQLKSISEQREKFEKQKASEEERIKHEKQNVEDYVIREREALEIAKESFEANMEHERSALAEKALSERQQMLHEFELQKSELGNDLQIKQEGMEKVLQEKEKLFEEEKERELKNINFLRDLARREMEEMKFERLRIEKERQEIEENKKHLQEQQLEMRDDIDKLGDLSKKLKDHREQFVKEKERFILFVEQHKSCKNCGEITSEFVLSDLISSQEIEKAVLLPNQGLIQSATGNCNQNLAATAVQDNDISPSAGRSASPVSWLRKCTSKIFSFSPGNKMEPAAVQNLTAPLLAEDREEPSKRLDFTAHEPELSFTIGNDSLDVQRIQSDSSIREAEAVQDFSIDDKSNINNEAIQVPEGTQPSNVKLGRQIHKRGRPRVSRTRSMKAVVQDAKAILGESLELNTETEDSSHLKAESRGESNLADEKISRNARKRKSTRASQNTVSEHGDGDGDESEGHSDSITAGKRRKRQQKVAIVQTPGEKRYNLRRPKKGAKPLSDIGREDKEEGGVRGPTSTGIASENGGNARFEQLEVVSDTDADSTRNLVEYAALSEEVNGTPDEGGEFGVAEEYRSESHRGDEDDEEDEDEDESVHPGEASIGKKLWTFFTT